MAHAGTMHPLLPVSWHPATPFNSQALQVIHLVIPSRYPGEAELGEGQKGGQGHWGPGSPSVSHHSHMYTVYCDDQTTCEILGHMHAVGTGVTRGDYVNIHTL